MHFVFRLNFDFAFCVANINGFTNVNNHIIKEL